MAESNGAASSHEPWYSLQYNGAASSHEPCHTAFSTTGLAEGGQQKIRHLIYDPHTQWGLGL